MKFVDGLTPIKRNKKLYCTMFYNFAMGEIIYKEKDGLTYILVSDHPRKINIKELN